MSDPSVIPTGPDLTAGLSIDSLEEGVPLLGHVEGMPVMLVRRGSDVFAIGATCTHYGGPLAEGLVVGQTVRCPWHHACFDLCTGRALRAPALNAVATYEVVRRQDSVVVLGPRETRAAAPARPPRADVPSSVAIIGAGAAGNSAAEELRHLGFEGTITLFDADESAPYDRPNLSKDYLAGTAREEWLPLHPRSHYKELALELALGRRVVEFDAAAKQLTLDDGTTRRFGAVVLATGADPVRLTIPGADGPPTHYLRNLADSRRIIAATEGARRAVVLGAGFIGLEVAASLRARGLDVHVVAPGTRPSERVLGAELGDFIRTLHEAHGVVFHLGQTARGVEPRHLVLQNGERLEADLLVAGVGVGPAVSLAERAGLRIDRGIVVDRCLETSAKGIFARSATWRAGPTPGAAPACASSIGCSPSGKDRRWPGSSPGTNAPSWTYPSSGASTTTCRSTMWDTPLGGIRSRSMAASSGAIAVCAIAQGGECLPWRAFSAIARASRWNSRWSRRLPRDGEGERR